MPDSVTLAAAAAAACGAVAAAACVRAGGGAELAAANAELAALRATLAAEQAEREKAEKNRQAEWAGRRKAEKQLLSDVKHGNAANLDYPLVPIGTAASCFRDCSGTPRQPGLATSTRVRLSFVKQLPPGALDGLDKHSHVWVIYVFHRNTNIGKALEVHGKHGAQFVGKVRPPRLGGKAKLGVLATRTPHRPNPIGLSLARLLSVDMKTRTVELAGTDLVDGTPILDIKPYLSSYDAPMPGQECFAPAWSLDPGGERPVEFLPAAEADWAACSGALKIYKGDATLARSALEQILASDVGRRPRDLEYLMRFDGVVVSYRIFPGTGSGAGPDPANDSCPTVVHAVGVDKCSDEDGRRRDLLASPDTPPTPPPLDPERSTTPPSSPSRVSTLLSSASTLGVSKQPGESDGEYYARVDAQIVASQQEQSR